MPSLQDEHLYSYPFASTADAGVIRLAASGGDAHLQRSRPAAATHTSTAFFHDRLGYPRQTAIMLRTLSEVVRTHFFDARPPQMDPIVTASRSVVRWEGFSGCCGAYARLDLDDSAFETWQPGFGTTNVDFNPAMLAHLSRIGQADEVQLAISSEAVTIERNDSAVTEKRVKLPKRWLKGLCEVQVYQSRLQLHHRFTPTALLPLLQAAGRGGAGEQFLILAASRPRLAARQTGDAVAIGGISRLQVLRPLLPLVREVNLYVDNDAGVHAWVAETDWCRFWLVLSPALHRGFSGEGQVLESLVDDGWQDRVDSVRDVLSEDLDEGGPAETIDPAELASRLGCTAVEARTGLAALATSGLAGFDAGTGYYFQRQLPFNLERVARDQPRLRTAQKLVDNNAVNVRSQISLSHADLEVTSGSTVYFVRLRDDGNLCSCPWFSRYAGQRGPCKHVLAAQMVLKAQHD